MKGRTISAAHVVADPLKEQDLWLDCVIDWDTTIAYRRQLWRLGPGVAKAMDTVQRGMGMDWPTQESSSTAPPVAPTSSPSSRNASMRAAPP